MFSLSVSGSVFCFRFGMVPLGSFHAVFCPYLCRGSFIFSHLSVRATRLPADLETLSTPRRRSVLRGGLFEPFTAESSFFRNKVMHLARNECRALQLVVPGSRIVYLLSVCAGLLACCPNSRGFLFP